MFAQKLQIGSKIKFLNQKIERISIISLIIDTINLGPQEKNAISDCLKLEIFFQYKDGNEILHMLDASKS